MASVFESARATAAAVRRRQVSAREIIQDALARIERRNAALNCFTRVFEERALATADRIDQALAAGADPGPLAGAPFAVKDLFDVAGVTTTAGAKQREGMAPAARDADAIARLEAAGAVLVGALNMDEFAYGFSTENAHYGVTRNPHDLERLAGGSSGGSAAAVAAGLAPLALGSDTNGSVRVPASLCGVFGLRPTHGAIPEAGMFPFVDRLDVAGPITSSLGDLICAFERLANVRCVLPKVETLRVARVAGWLGDNAGPEARAAIATACACLETSEAFELRSAEAGRSAAFLLTAKEGGQRHLAGLQRDADAFDPATRARFVAGALLPASAVADAERAGDRFIAEFEEVMSRCDVLIAPATPTPAPRIAEGAITLNGKTVSARANLGVCAQPISLTGAPALSAPMRGGGLPIGVQLIAARGREAALFAVAGRLVEAGVAGFEAPPGFGGES